MNQSVVAWYVHSPGAPPDHLSMGAWTTSCGGWKSAIGCLSEMSRMNECQTCPGPADANVASLSVRTGAEWSLLPIQTPTAIAGFFGSAGGARKP
jgi:hypothetical protein